MEKSPEKSGQGRADSAKSSAHLASTTDDASLEELLDVWATLPELIKQGIVAIARGAAG